MALSVIGAGFGRTGTLSMKLALEQLGFGPCYHMSEVIQHPHFTAYWAAAARGDPVDWDEVFDGYASTVDWPSCSYYRELAEHFPEAKVVLTIRDPKGWFESVQRTIFSAANRERVSSSLGASGDAHMRDMTRKIFVETFDRRADDAEHAIAVFRKHTETVKRTIPAQRLLVHEAGEGWDRLCAFLGVAVPATPYPKVNTTEHFNERWREREGSSSPREAGDGR